MKLNVCYTVFFYFCSIFSLITTVAAGEKKNISDTLMLQYGEQIKLINNAILPFDTIVINFTQNGINGKTANGNLYLSKTKPIKLAVDYYSGYILAKIVSAKRKTIYFDKTLKQKTTLPHIKNPLLKILMNGINKDNFLLHKIEDSAEYFTIYTWLDEDFLKIMFKKDNQYRLHYMSIMNHAGNVKSSMQVNLYSVNVNIDSAVFLSPF